MGVTCNLYQCTRFKPHLSRLLTNIAIGHDIQDENIEKFSLTDPVICVKNSDYVNIFGRVNYMFLGAPFNRYYFLGSPEAGTDGITRIPCHVDVLYTYKAVILASQCIAKRSSSNFNIALNDDMVQFERGYIYNFSKFPYTFTPENGDYILQVAGGS